MTSPARRPADPFAPPVLAASAVNDDPTFIHPHDLGLKEVGSGYVERDDTVLRLAGFDIPEVTEVVEEYLTALERQQAAADDLRDLRRDLAARQKAHSDKVTEAVRNGKKPPKPSTFAEEEAAIRDAELIFREHGKMTTGAAARARRIAAHHFPTMRATLLARIDEAQAVTEQAHAKLRDALATRDGLFGSFVRIEQAFAVPFATEVAGLRSPVTPNHQTLRAAVEGLSAAGNGVDRNLDHALRQAQKSFDAFAALRRVIDSNRPEDYLEHATAKARQMLEVEPADEHEAEPQPAA